MTIARNDVDWNKDKEDYKYYLFGYRESWYRDETSSEFSVTRTNKPEEIAAQIYYYKESHDDWQVYLMVNGKPTVLSSFDAAVKEYADKLEQQRLEYKRKEEERNKAENARFAKAQEATERAMFERLKAKYEGGK